METSFWNSNLFQTIVLILTIGATVGIALWQFRAHRRKELQNAVSILLLQIKDIEANIEYMSSEGLLNGMIQEVPMHYSTIIFEENQWNKYAHSVVGHLSQESFEKIDSVRGVLPRCQSHVFFLRIGSLHNQFCCGMSMNGIVHLILNLFEEKACRRCITVIVNRS